MLTVKVLDERGVNNVPGRDPAPLLGAVALPVHQVLVAPDPDGGRRAGGELCKPQTHQRVWGVVGVWGRSWNPDGNTGRA